MCEFYVYVIFRPNGIPCYVGKGKGDRAEHHNRGRSHNLELTALVKERGPLPVVIVREGLTETDALFIESSFISALRVSEHGGILFNRAKRAPHHPAGWKHTAEARAKISAVQKGRRPSDATLAASKAAFTGKPLSPEHREKLRQAKLGTKRSPEVRAKLSAALAVRMGSPDGRAKLSEMLRLRWAKHAALKWNPGPMSEAA